MNTNPTAKTILCYGDSNTHGSKPDRSGRYAPNERWPGVLQSKLGSGYNIIEEGLGGRTTDLEHYDPNANKPTRNGLTYFTACIDSHMPLDIIVIMLGTNDLKTAYNRSAQDVAGALRQYPEYIKRYCDERDIEMPTVILVSPAYMDALAPKFVTSMPQPGIYDETSAATSHQLAAVIQKVAEDNGCLFLDAATVTQTGEDGCHLNLESHESLGHSIYKIITELH